MQIGFTVHDSCVQDDVIQPVRLHQLFRFFRIRDTANNNASSLKGHRSSKTCVRFSSNGLSQRHVVYYRFI